MQLINFLSKYANYFLVILVLIAPLAIFTGCVKQNSMDMARVGQ